MLGNIKGQLPIPNMHQSQNKQNPGKQFKFSVRSGTKHIPVFDSELASPVSKTVATPNLKNKTT